MTLQDAQDCYTSMTQNKSLLNKTGTQILDTNLKPMYNCILHFPNRCHNPIFIPFIRSLSLWSHESLYHSLMAISSAHNKLLVLEALFHFIGYQAIITTSIEHEKYSAPQNEYFQP